MASKSHVGKLADDEAVASVNSGAGSEKRRLRLAVVADEDPRNVKAWSGIPSFMVPSLEACSDLVIVDGQPLPAWARRMIGVLARLSGGRIDLQHWAWLMRLLTRGLHARLSAAAPDAVLALCCSPLATCLAGSFRVVNLGDTTGAGIVDYYPEYRRRPAWVRRAISRVSREAVRSSWLTIYPSRWAVDVAVADSGRSHEDILEIAWGANLDPLPNPNARHLSVPLRMLFVGYDWVRKGGPLAAAVTQELNRRNVPARLDVVGPPGPPDHLRFRQTDEVVFHGRIDKADPAQRERLAALYRDAHIFFMPTHAECFGMVFAEAAANALPSVALRTGGVTSAVVDGTTGILFDPRVDAATIADWLAELVESPERYAAMSAAARSDADHRLNWAVWAERVTSEIAARLDSRPLAQ